MLRLKTNFFLSLSYILAIEIAVILVGSWHFIHGSKYTRIAGLVLCLIAVPAAKNLWLLYRFLKGGVFYYDTHSVRVNGGIFTIDVPTYAFEVWLFFKTPISRFYGKIRCFNVDMSRDYVRNVPRRASATAFRSDCTPILLRPESAGVIGSGKCNIEFKLKPVLKGSLLDEAFPSDEVVFVTVMVKSLECKCRPLMK
jgi:hypothetical protein